MTRTERVAFLARLESIHLPISQGFVPTVLPGVILGGLALIGLIFFLVWVGSDEVQAWGVGPPSGRASASLVLRGISPLRGTLREAMGPQGGTWGG